MKNTIEDFTDDKEIIEIEKLMLDKKWNESSERIIDYRKILEDIFSTLNDKEKEKELYKFCILTFVFVICNQHINLKLAIDIIFYNLHNKAWKNVAIYMFLCDILQKILNDYYDKEQIEIIHKTASSLNTTVEKMKDIAKKEIQIILMMDEAEALIENEIGIYLFNKFQSN